MNAIAQLNQSLVGRYVVEREIGRGGMATVFLARDLKHDRNVALKVLNPDLGAVLGVERFLAEIKVTASLQHPNLLPLFDSGEADGLLFYVMPYVEGESLRVKLRREKQLPVDEAIHIATAVAGALQHAHERGVIHRDLKPENILLQGREPLVADFGIALAVSRAGGERITQTGISLGTPQYMSPEQATGDRVVDARADVYSLGAMLYEMLTGDPPHSGSTAQAVIARVLTERPHSVRLQRDTVPQHISDAIDTALAKLPADRFVSVADFAQALIGASVVIPTTARVPGVLGQPARRVRVERLRRLAPWALLLVVTTAFATVMAPHWREQPPVVRFSISVPRSQRVMLAGNYGPPVAISPDGRLIVYSGLAADDRQLYVRQLDVIGVKPIPGTEHGRNPAFSPDGRWIAFFADGQLKVVPSTGGTAVALSDLTTPFGITWTTNDEIVFAKASEGNGAVLWRVSLSSRQPRAFTTRDTASQEGFQYWPVALHDGRTVLYASYVRGNLRDSRIGVASLDRGRIGVLDVLGTAPLGVFDDRLIYARTDGAIMAVPFDTRTLKVTGTPYPLNEQVFAAYGGAAVSLSRSGSLIFVEGTDASSVAMVDEKGVARELVPTARRFGHPRMSPDGSRLAVDIGNATASDIWIYDVRDLTLTRLSTTATNDRPEWTPDGKRVVYAATVGGLFQLSWQPSDGSGAAEVLLRTNNPVREAIVTPDGRRVVYREDHPDTRRDILAFDLAGDRKPWPVVKSGADELMPRISPDGRWLAYISDESGQYEVYVRPFPGMGARVQVSIGGGMEPLWSRDGTRLFYREEDQVIEATVSTVPTFAVRSRRPMFSGDFVRDIYHPNYDVAPDGRHFIMLKPADDDLRIVVVLNWLQAQRKRSPAP